MSAPTIPTPRCRVCGHPLSNPRSIRRAIGPECRRRALTAELVLDGRGPVRVVAWVDDDGRLRLEALGAVA